MVFFEGRVGVPQWGWVDDRGGVIDLSRERSVFAHASYVVRTFAMDPGYEDWRAEGGDPVGFALAEGWIRFWVQGRGDVGVNFDSKRMSRRAFGVMYRLISAGGGREGTVYVEDDGVGFLDDVGVYSVGQFLKLFRRGYRVLKKSLTRSFREFFSDFSDRDFDCDRGGVLSERGEGCLFSEGSRINPVWSYDIPVGWISNDGVVHEIGGLNHDEYIRWYFDLEEDGDVDEWEFVFERGWIRVVRIYDESEFNVQFDERVVGRRAFDVLYKMVLKKVPEDVKVLVGECGRDETERYTKEMFLKFFRGGYRTLAKSRIRAWRAL